MWPVILLFWIAGAATTSGLQPNLNVSSGHNVSLERETWTESGPDHFPEPPAVGDEELKLDQEEPDDVRVQKIRDDEHRVLKNTGGKQRHEKRQDDENKTKDQSVDPFITPSVETPLATMSSSHDFSYTIFPPLRTTTTTPSPADMTPVNPDFGGHVTEMNRSLFSDRENISTLSADENITHKNSSLSLIRSAEKSKAKSKLKHMAKTRKDKTQKKEKKVKKSTKLPKNANQLKKKEDQVTAAPSFPYFEDDYCPPDCACYGRVIQCSDKGLEKIPYGIPYNSRYILLMNNRITSIPPDLLSEYLSLEFLVLSNNRLIDAYIEGAFEGIQAMKKLYLERNLLQSVPGELPASLEELRLDGNDLTVMSETAWFRCPGLLILSLSNNSLGSVSSSFPVGVLSQLSSLRTLSLSHNRLTSVPLHLPISLQELYLRGNLIQRLQAGIFHGKAQLQILDLSANKLTNKGLGKGALINATRLESLNLEGNLLKQVPRHLPKSLKTLNLEGNSISSISKATFLSLPHLEHLGLANNKISKVVPGAFRVLPLLHQLDLSHNVLHQVPRQLPDWLVHIALNHNKIQMIPRDAFCSLKNSVKSHLIKVQLEHNLVDLSSLDSMAFSCLRGFQVVHFY